MLTAKVHVHSNHYAFIHFFLFSVWKTEKYCSVSAGRQSRQVFVFYVIQLNHFIGVIIIKFNGKFDLTSLLKSLTHYFLRH